MFELISAPFYQQQGHGGVMLNAWRCAHCPRVELSKKKMILHLAVVHGIRRLPEERLKELRNNGIQI